MDLGHGNFSVFRGFGDKLGSTVTLAANAFASEQVWFDILEI